MYEFVVLSLLVVVRRNEDVKVGVDMVSLSSSVAEPPGSGRLSRVQLAANTASTLAAHGHSGSILPVTVTLLKYRGEGSATT